MRKQKDGGIVTSYVSFIRNVSYFYPLLTPSYAVHLSQQPIITFNFNSKTAGLSSVALLFLYMLQLCLSVFTQKNSSQNRELSAYKSIIFYQISTHSAFKPSGRSASAAEMSIVMLASASVERASSFSTKAAIPSTPSSQILNVESTKISVTS